MSSRFFFSRLDLKTPEDISAGRGVPACLILVKDGTVSARLDLQLRLKRFFPNSFQIHIIPHLFYHCPSWWERLSWV